MAKNSIDQPLFLNEQKARELNNCIYKNTGCFVFIRIPEEHFYSPVPNSKGGHNFLFNILNLYKMYKDYGNFFLLSCIQEPQLPNPAYLDINDRYLVQTLSNDRKRILDHYKFITQTSRHVMAHGIFQLTGAVNSYKDPKIIEMENCFINVLSNKNWPQTDKDWKLLSKWITDEADYFYNWLIEWASLWGKCIDGKEDLKNRFYHGIWDLKDEVSPYKGIELEEKYTFEYNGNSFPLFELNDNTNATFTKSFSYQMVVDAKDYLCAAASGRVRSEYEEGGVHWDSNKPEKNLSILYKNINFSGVNAVRTKMETMELSKEYCPDVYKLYLGGLANKMLSLPVLPAVRTRIKKQSKFKK